MKILTIGDIHGLTTWKEVDPNEYDKIIFVGDYVDSYDVSNITILKNLNDIIDFKKQYSDKVILLFGNHDIQYLYDEETRYKCSGYRYLMSYDLKKVFNDNKDLFQYAYQLDNVIWTHAGITEMWAKEILKDVDKYEYANKINELAQEKKTLNDIMLVGRSRGGFALTGGPLWADFNSDVKDDPITGLIQIFGHTEVDKIKIIEGYNYELINVDTLQSSGEMYEREFEFIEE
jgi:predicted phosphodiesterase